MDNPPGCFGDNYYEHLDFLQYIPAFQAPSSFLYLTVNLLPYEPNLKNNANDDYKAQIECQKNWMKKRSDFYGQINLTILDAIKFYLNYFKKQNCEFNFAKWHLRKSDIKNHPDNLLYLLLGCV